MNSTLLMVATLMLVVVTIFHAVMGQKILISPMLRERAGLMNDEMPRKIIQFSWQAQTVLMALPALYLALVAFDQTEGSAIMVAAIGLSFFGMGLANGMMTRFRHPGGFLLGGAGLLILLALYI